MTTSRQNEAYVTFYSPRAGAPKTLAPNNFRFASKTRSVYNHIVGILKVVQGDLVDRNVTIHLHWPLSSWQDKLSIGVMVFNIMRLPRFFSEFNFNMNYPARPYQGEGTKG